MSPRDVIATELHARQGGTCPSEAMYAAADAILSALAAAGYEVNAKGMREALVSIKWQSCEKDNMEFSARITCFQMDAIRALKEPGT